MMNEKYYANFMVLICLLLLIFPGLVGAQSIEIYDISPVQVESKGFVLDGRCDLTIEAAVGEYRSKSDLLSNCWILNTENNKLVWEFSKRDAERSRSRKMLTLEKTITLPEGNYEVYYALNPQRNIIERKIFGLIFNSDSRKYYSSEWGITVQPVSKSERYFHVRAKQQQDEHVVVQMINIYDDEYHKKGFTLTAPVKLRIYAIGEGTRSGRQMSDFGWITNVKTRERVWEMKYRKTDPAGGASKNRKFDGEITLPA